MYRLFVFSAVLLLIVNYSTAKKKKLNLRPAIGVLTQKVRSKLAPKVTSSHIYVAASYVKWLEMAGAQVVPLLSTYSEDQVLQLMQSVNGVLLPGGGEPLTLNDSKYINTAKVIFDEAIRLNDQGVHFPLWGTCLGFEAFINLGAAKDIVVRNLSAMNVTMELNLTKEAYTSRLFEFMERPLLQDMMFEKITINMHNVGITPALMQANKKLKSMFQILSTNYDLKGVEFVSTIEGIKYPFYATQWHPEKNNFEWTHKVGINHSPPAIRLSQYLANFFVNEARRNFQSFTSIEEENEHFIQKWAPVFSGATSPSFEQVYVFGNNTEHVQQ